MLTWLGTVIRKEHTKLMSILLLDGFVFFAVVYAAMFSNMLIWAVGSVSTLRA